MIGIPFYNQTIRNTVAVFGSLFNNIVIKRRDGKILPVPIAYGPRQKWMEAQKQFKQEEEMFEKLLPRMSYEIVAMSYVQQRKLTNKQNIIAKNDGSVVQKTHSPVPYYLDFSLYIQTKNLNDGWQIIEQILPFFTPAYTVRVRNFPVDNDSDTPVPENEYDIPFTLQSVTWSDDWTGDIADRRTIEWVLEFQTRIWMHGPPMGRSVTKVILDSRAIIATPGNPDTVLSSMKRSDSDYAGIETGYVHIDSDESPTYQTTQFVSPNVINTSDSEGNIVKIIRDIEQF